MRIPVLLITMTLVALSLTGSNHDPAPAPSDNLVAWLSILDQSAGVPTKNAPRFSSLYTNLTRCGSGLTKKEEKEAEEHGTDIPSRCKGYGGYVIDISYSACASNITAEKGESRIHVAMQAVNFKQKTVEWRMANGKPFAIIMRVYEYGGNDQCTTDGTVTGESLVIKGLKGYEQINAEVKVKGTAEPNVKAREIADKGYQ